MSKLQQKENKRSENPNANAIVSKNGAAPITSCCSIQQEAKAPDDVMSQCTIAWSLCSCDRTKSIV